MHAGRHYSMREVFTWTRRETFLFTLLAAVPVALHGLDVELPAIPWQPLAVLGTAVAFITGFKNNAAYGRLWEARKIWGGIVNTSRTWAVLTRDYVTPDEGEGIVERLVHRQIAWLTALRHQLRQRRAWENAEQRHNVEFRQNTYTIPECAGDLQAELAPLLDADELREVLAAPNRAVALLGQQSAELKRAAAAGWLSEYRHVELTRLIAELFDHQGRSERIKNFPYPRQFATLNLIFVWLFVCLVPFGLFSELQRIAPEWVWLTIPFTTVIAWVFHTMDKIGEASENPFEGGPNDVPITSMSRGIEIDLRNLIGETELPEPHQPEHGILM